MKKLFLILLLIAPLAAHAQSCTTSTCNAAGVSEAQVLAALPSSSNTNATVVVNIPSGSASWTTGFSYTIPSAVTTLTIQGATTVSCTGTEGSSGYSCSATDNTVITDNYASNSPLMTFTVGGASSFFRITGLTIKGGTSFSGGGCCSKYDGWIQTYSGNSQNFRMDHNDFNNTSSPYQQVTMFRTYAPIAGVIDHNVFQMVSGQYDFGVSDFGAYNDTIGDGDGTFANPTLWGSSHLLYVEANYLTGGGVINDCGGAGSMAIRYNKTVNATTAVQTHGTKSDAGASRGCRMIEIYHNYFGGTSTGDAATGSKNAAALVWGNTMPSGAYYRFYAPAADRNINPANVNESAGQPTDWGFCGTAINGTGSTWDGNSSASTGYPCLDGIGRGQDQQAMNGAGTISGRLNSVTGTQAWTHQYLEPNYLFANTLTPNSGVEVSPRDQTTTVDRDYYSECNTGFSDSTCKSSAFNGTHGTGSGLLASRPSSCTAGPGGTYGTSPTGSYGVGYWATDANSGNGELYVCTATGAPGTWTAIYQPYTYPHPLISGVTLTPTSISLGAASTSLTAGSSDLLTATLSPSTGPTGTVTFYDGGSSIGTGSVSGGAATFNVTAITAGTHTYTAGYSGDSTYASSTSSSVTVTATGGAAAPTGLVPRGVALQ